LEGFAGSEHSRTEFDDNRTTYRLFRCQLISSTANDQLTFVNVAANSARWCWTFQQFQRSTLAWNGRVASYLPSVILREWYPSAFSWHGSAPRDRTCPTDPWADACKGRRGGDAEW